jgi:DNA ligase-1
VIGTIELNHNRNVKTKDERGFSKRSTHKAGKEAAGVLGCLRVRDVATGVEFDVGTGFTWAQREALWSRRDTLSRPAHQVPALRYRERGQAALPHLPRLPRSGETYDRQSHPTDPVGSSRCSASSCARRA